MPDEDDVLAVLHELLRGDMVSDALRTEIDRLIGVIEAGGRNPGFSFDDVRRAADVWERTHPTEGYDRLVERAKAQQARSAVPLLARAVVVELQRRLARPPADG